MRAEEPDRGQVQQAEEERESIWSITRGQRALYFGLFSLYAFAGIGFLIWYHVFERRADAWPETILSVTQGIGVNTVGAAGLALLTIEGPKTIVVLADYITERWLNPLKERNRAKAHAQGRAEGRVEGEAQNQAAWLAWNERRLAAEANGEDFDEPPPGTSPTESE